MIRVPAYGSPVATVSATLVSPAGQPIRELSVVQPNAASSVAQISLPLAGLPPGQYSVEIAAKASAGAAKDKLSFRVND